MSTLKLEAYRALGMRTLEAGLYKIELKLDSEPGRWQDDVYDKIFEVGLQLKSMTARQLGYCSYKKSLIVVNYTNPAHFKPEEFVDTVLHELAHHIAHCIYGAQNIKPHGKEWKSICVIVGANPEATFKDTGIPKQIINASFAPLKD